MTQDTQPKYDIGDIVQLNAGGPEMAIQSQIQNRDGIWIGSYKCQWFAGKKLDNGNFPEESLILIKKQGT